MQSRMQNPAVVLSDAMQPIQQLFKAVHSGGVDKQTLETAPGFDKDNWPDMADNTWGANVYRHYGANPYWENEQEEKTFRGGGGL